MPGFLDYLTFWGRKSAASGVGRADFREFMARLQQTLDDHNNRSSTDTRGHPLTYLGLVSIGHSFGGQALLDATSAFLEAELQGAGRGPVYLRQLGPVATKPRSRGRCQASAISSCWSIPPSRPAYQRIYALSMGFEYGALQTPLVLTISAENDGPRHSLFEIGRFLGEIFTAAASRDDPRQREMSREALGVYAGQVTHRLAPIDESVTFEKIRARAAH